MIEECTQDWTFPENSFDYVHIRSLSGCIKDWTSLFEEAYKCLKPGGWLESFEPSPYIRCDNATLPPKSAVAQWGQLFVEASKITQRTVRVVDDGIQMNAMQEAGFVNLHEKEIKVCAHLLSERLFCLNALFIYNRHFLHRFLSVAGLRIHV